MVERIWTDFQVAHNYHKKNVKPEEVAAIEQADDPVAAADAVSQYVSEKACAIIDSMSPLGAAFVLCILKMKMQHDGRAEAIVKRAEILKIRGIKGLSQARDEMFKSTGVWLP